MSKRKKKQKNGRNLEIEGMHMTPLQIEYLFVIIEKKVIPKLIAGKSQNDLDILAVSLAYALWDKNSIRRCEKLVSLAGTEKVNKLSALNCVKNNFPTVRHNEYFLVKIGHIVDVGKAALVIALNSPPLTD